MINIPTIQKEERLKRLDNLLIKEGTALDVGSAHTFPKLYHSRSFKKAIAINPHQPLLTQIQGVYLERTEWEFLCIDIRDYKPVEDFDLITMFHVVEHLTLPDLTNVLDRLTSACRNQFVIETPEQFDSNKWSVKERNNPYELHRSLVTADFLSSWGFRPLFRYWMNKWFSNAVYVRNKDK